MTHNDGVMHAGPGTKPGTDNQVDGHHGHPDERAYIKIAIILATITLIEVVIYYIEALEAVLVPTLMLLSAAKFIIVVGYFMHLKFDDRRLMWIFAGGLATAFAVFIGLWVMQYFHYVVEFVQQVGSDVT